MIMDDVVQKDMVSYFFFSKLLIFLMICYIMANSLYFFRKERVVNV